MRIAPLRLLALGLVTLASGVSACAYTRSQFRNAAHGIPQSSNSVSGAAFKKHGLTLEILYTQGGPELIQAVISGSMDMAMGVGCVGCGRYLRQRGADPNYRQRDDRVTRPLLVRQTGIAD